MKMQQNIPSDAPGSLVVISSRFGDCVWLGWSKRGHELDLLESVQVGERERLFVRHTWDATFGDAVAFRIRHHESNFLGNWFSLSPELLADIYAMTAWERDLMQSAANDDDAYETAAA